MKRPILFLSTFLCAVFSNNSMALSEETNICIRNTTDRSHYIEVTDIEDYDWDGVDRPNVNFTNIGIRVGDTICHREEINKNSFRQAFTFLIDGNPTRMLLNRTYNDDNTTNYHWGAYTNSSNTTTLHGEYTLYWLPSNWWVGYGCNGKDCALFELR